MNKNKNPVQNLEQGEIITVHLLNINGLYQQLIEYKLKNYEIDSRLIAFASGLDFIH